MRASIVERRGQRAGGGVAVPVGDLGFEDARGAGAEKDADARSTELRACHVHRVGKAVLFERELREPVIATLERGEVGAQWLGVKPRDLGDHRVELHRLEAARRERRAALRQRLRMRVDAAAEPGNSRIGKKAQHDGPGYS